MSRERHCYSSALRGDYKTLWCCGESAMHPSPSPGPDPTRTRIRNQIQIQTGTRTQTWSRIWTRILTGPGVRPALWSWPAILRPPCSLSNYKTLCYCNESAMLLAPSPCLDSDPQSDRLFVGPPACPYVSVGLCFRLPLWTHIISGRHSGRVTCAAQHFRNVAKTQRDWGDGCNILWVRSQHAANRCKFTAECFSKRTCEIG